MKKTATGLGLALAATSLTFVAAPAQAAPEEQRAGTKSLAEVLTSDGNKFDRNGKDYDILTEAALAVVAAKPDSPVALIADGKQRLTVFAPDDDAFRDLAKALLGKNVKKERKLFGALVDAAGVDLIEQVLLYHVVPGATITAKKAVKADGAKLVTAQGKKIKVKVRHGSVMIKDRDPDSADATVIVPDVNKGNRQVAHGIDAVLLPQDF